MTLPSRATLENGNIQRGRVSISRIDGFTKAGGRIKMLTDMRFGKWLVLFFGLMSSATGAVVTGVVTDAETGKPLPARIYIQSATDKTFFLAASGSAQGSAVPYVRKNGLASIEIHTALSAHPFAIDLPKGDYILTAIRGKEYFPAVEKFSVPRAEPIQVPLKRWINLAERGWFSGDTHVHRKLSELPIVQLAEDLNVAFPLTSWVTDSREAPASASKSPEPMPAPQLKAIDPTHVFWPVNTEYEIFTVNGKTHTLGAVFILNHQMPFPHKAPPVGPIAAEAERQGGILELDKHNWPWSMMIVKKMGVQLYELSNNHVWRTRFGFANWYSEYASPAMGIEMNGGAFTERGWIQFGMENYYTLLNCGMKLQPTAGTASGVHPVPLGFGRVYVKVEGGFSYEKWLAGLREGRSFVTTGPMLFTEITREGNEVRVKATLEAPVVGGIEIVRNGEVALRVTSQPELMASGSQRAVFEETLPLDGSAWFAVRSFTQRDGRPRFAHTAPVHFEVAGKPLRPRKQDTDYLIKRVADELKRHEGVLAEEALEEYREVLAFYRQLAENAGIETKAKAE